MNTTRKTATDLGPVNPDARGNQRLYRLTPPLVDTWRSEDEQQGYEYVVASAADVFGEPEVYLFPSTDSGEITNWSELPGSLRGTLDHEDALKDAGYEVVQP